jgi:hypothetical protein
MQKQAWSDCTTVARMGRESFQDTMLSSSQRMSPSIQTHDFCRVAREVTADWARP